jgi:hypothetical protein
MRVRGSIAVAFGLILTYSVQEHERGGHFSALDNPTAYVNDIRTMMGRWYKP